MTRVCGVTHMTSSDFYKRTCLSSQMTRSSLRHFGIQNEMTVISATTASKYVIVCM